MYCVIFTYIKLAKGNIWYSCNMFEASFTHSLMWLCPSMLTSHISFLRQLCDGYFWLGSFLLFSPTI